MTEGEALIHLRVPAATKARWVRESRAAGMRLTDWIVARIDGQKRLASAWTPEGVPVEVLQGAESRALFNWIVLKGK